MPSTPDALPPSVRPVNLLGLQLKGAVSDWLKAGHSVSELKESGRIRVDVVAGPRWQSTSRADLWKFSGIAVQAVLVFGCGSRQAQQMSHRAGIHQEPASNFRRLIAGLLRHGVDGLLGFPLVSNHLIYEENRC